MGITIIAQKDVFFFDHKERTRICVTSVPWDDNWRLFKAHAWRALAATLHFDCHDSAIIERLKRRYVLERQVTCGLGN